MAVICPDCKIEFGVEDLFCGSCGRPKPQSLKEPQIKKPQTMVLSLSTLDNPETEEDESLLRTVLAPTDSPPRIATVVEEPALPLPPVDGPIGFQSLVPVPLVAAPPVQTEPTFKPNPDPWLCKQCNTLNIAADEYCNICGALRVSIAPEPVPTLRVVEGSPEAAPDLLAKVLAPHKEGDPRLGWHYVTGQATNEGVARFGTANEDSSFQLELVRIFQSKPEPFGLYIVADGMGGQVAGETASRLAIEAISSMVVAELVTTWLGGEKLETQVVEQTLLRAVQEAHHRVRQANLEHERDSGTTVTVVCLIDNMAAFANVGDSRTYLFRPWKEKKAEEPTPTINAQGKTLKLTKQRTDKLSTNGKPNGKNPAEAAATPQPRLEIQRVTRDQSLVQNLVDAGKLSIADVYTDPRRNVVLNAIGSPDEDIPVDLYRRILEPGDTLLLCSDGMWEMARDDALAERILTLDHPQACAEELVALACRNGGADNVSVIVVQVERI
ncbi:MAG: protein phosphatase 2C domain-containing protein [Chloroflexota bacterium]|nr:SpoIIE family protein phosphatase [Chloroflexota bacterium]